MKENNDTLLTFGEEALTMRTDDPRTQKHKKEMLKKMEKNKKMYEEVFKNPFIGVDLSNTRGENENYDEYRTRLKLNNMLLKQYKKAGKDRFLEMYPAGVKYAIDQAKVEIVKNNKPPLIVTKAEEVQPDGSKKEININKIK